MNYDSIEEQKFNGARLQIMFSNHMIHYILNSCCICKNLQNIILVMKKKKNILLISKDIWYWEINPLSCSFW